MSSLRINGMAMPKNCAECPILQTGSLEHYCPLAKESMWSIDAESGRHNNCPLSEIPTPHGDLIDKQKLLEQVGYESYSEMKVPLSALMSAPVVIEADGRHIPDVSKGPWAISYQDDCDGYYGEDY